MGETAADRAAIADLVMRDVADRLPQQRMRRRQPPIVLDVAPAHQGAEAHAVVADVDIAEPGNAPQIDEQARRRQAEGENRHQALPAGDDGRLGIGPEQSDGFPQGARGLVIEGRGFHSHASRRERTGGNLERVRESPMHRPQTVARASITRNRAIQCRCLLDKHVTRPFHWPPDQPRDRVA